ncbi:MAG: sensor histidine kinase [Candidatus Acidiferrales bacterium]
MLRARFLDRLRADPESGAEVQRAESVLATARAFLATSGLLAIYLDPTEPTRYATIAYALLTAYALESLGVMLWLRWRESGPALRLAVHSIDILFAAVITVFTEGANSPLFVFFLFVLLAAAYRWAWWETLVTAGAAIGVLLLEAAVMMSSDSPAAAIIAEPVQQNRFITRCAYLLIMGVLLGYLAEEDKQRRAETTFLARLTSRLQTSPSLRGNLAVVLEEVMGLFGGTRALLAVEETSSGRLFLWEARDASGHVTLTQREIDPGRRDAYVFAPPGEAWLARRGAKGAQVVALQANCRRRDPAPAVAASFAEAHPFRSLTLLSLRFGAEWVGQLFLLNPIVSGNPEPELRFLQRLARQVAPALYSTYLVRRLRARAGALERARVAHELHDGVIQSLISLEMQVEVLRRRAAALPPESQPSPDADAGASELGPASLPRPGDDSAPFDSAQDLRQGLQPELAEEMARLQRLLHHEILNVRELMLQMRPLELDPQRLLEFLAETVDRFQRDTGITARFISELDDVQMPPRVCRELARIVQEALVNVRKHSGASNVLVRFGSHNGCWRLVVDDDGKGFPFTGRHTQAELDADRRGPLVIKERVRNIGGELAIESTPGGGARLEITLPQSTRA